MDFTLKAHSSNEFVHEIMKLDKTIAIKVVLPLWRWCDARNKVNAGEKLQSAFEIGCNMQPWPTC